MDDYLLIAKSTILELSIPLLLSSILAIIIGYSTAIITIGSKRKSRVIIFCAMFGYYGVTLGFLIGASNDSMVRDAFSTVVTISSGYFAYILSKDIHPRLKAMIPAAIICFLLSLLISATFIAKLRNAFGL